MEITDHKISTRIIYGRFMLRCQYGCLIQMVKQYPKPALTFLMSEFLVRQRFPARVWHYTGISLLPSVGFHRIYAKEHLCCFDAFGSPFTPNNPNCGLFP